MFLLTSIPVDDASRSEFLLDKRLGQSDESSSNECRGGRDGLAAQDALVDIDARKALDAVADDFECELAFVEDLAQKLVFCCLHLLLDCLAAAEKMDEEVA